MNRQQKRKAKLNNFLHEGMKKGMKREATDVATLLMFYISLLVLRDKYGFGKKRLSEFMEHATNLLESLSESRLDFIDIRDTIKNETGFEVDLPERRFL